MSSYGRFATFKTKQDKADEVASILIQESQLALEKASCQIFIVSNDINISNRVRIFSLWDSKEAAMKIINTSKAKKNRSKLRPLLENVESVEVDVLNWMD